MRSRQLPESIKNLTPEKIAEYAVAGAIICDNVAKHLRAAADRILIAQAAAKLLSNAEVDVESLDKPESAR